MDRRTLLRHAGVGLAALPALLATARRAPARPSSPHGWVARLDDPALGGRPDGVTVNDEAVLQALADMPEGGGTLVLGSGGVWLFDAVDLARVGRRGVTIRADGATVRKAPTTPGHMFYDTAGTSDGLTVVGGVWEAGGRHFEPGQTSSPFHLDRADDVAFLGATFRDGVEEGLKLYAPVGVTVDRCRFERFRNNGVQLHAAPVTGFRGDKPLRGPARIRVTRSVFVDVDDGLEGWEGQGLSVGSTVPGHPARHVRVRGCRFEGCVRGAWSENNVEDTAGRDIWFEDNVVVRSRFHGLGLVGVRGGGLVGNRLVDVGTTRPDPPRTASSEVAGLVLSGSERVEGRDVVVRHNEVVDGRGAGALMEYGILARLQRRLTVRDNVVRGATVAALSAVRVEASTLEPPSTG